jgi:hypothetical protein
MANARKHVAACGGDTALSTRLAATLMRRQKRQVSMIGLAQALRLLLEINRRP